MLDYKKVREEFKKILAAQTSKDVQAWADDYAKRLADEQQQLAAKEQLFAEIQNKCKTINFIFVENNDLQSIPNYFLAA